jgi:hypothetical protein
MNHFWEICAQRIAPWLMLWFAIFYVSSIVNMYTSSLPWICWKEDWHSWCQTSSWSSSECQWDCQVVVVVCTRLQVKWVWRCKRYAQPETGQHWTAALTSQRNLKDTLFLWRVATIGTALLWVDSACKQLW